MYCIKCGVKMADSERHCPLCQTKVYHPDFPEPNGETLYPQDKYPINPKQAYVGQIITTALFLLTIFTVLLCDLQLFGGVTWSGYVIGALLIAYSIVVLPSWFRNPNPVIFVPCAFAVVIGYLLYINFAVDGNWFLSFAFPLAGGIGLIFTAMVTLLKYVPKGKLYTVGGCCIAMGGLMLLTEFLANITFHYPRFIGWSLYPLAAFFLLCGFLIYLAIYPPAREAMERKFFI